MPLKSVETRVAYHHPWLGLVYYRGFLLNELIKADLSLLECAYLLTSSNFLEHSLVYERVFSLRQSEVDALISETLEHITSTYLANVEGIRELAFTPKDAHNRCIQNLLISHLNSFVGSDTIALIHCIMDGGDLVKCINGAYQQYREYVLNNILRYHRYLTSEDEAKVGAFRRFIKSDRSAYVELLKSLAIECCKDSGLYDYVLKAIKFEKTIRSSKKKYLNVDFYTPLILLKYGLLDFGVEVLFLARALGYLPYVLESRGYRRKPAKLIYRGPINVRVDVLLKAKGSGTRSTSEST